MKQLQFYKYTTLGLLLLNILMVAFFMFTRPRPQGAAFAARVFEILHLDEQQQPAFRETAEAHNQQMVAIEEQQRQLLERYFRSLTEPEAQINSDSLLQQVEKLEGQKIESTYQHFAEVKKLLRTDQQAHFAEFVNSALRVILWRDQRPAAPPRDKRERK